MAKNVEFQADGWLRSIAEYSKREEVILQLGQINKIQQVPSLLRENARNKECYDPLVVSIGPIHHGNPKFGEVEKVKIAMTSQFVKDMRHPIDVVFNEVEKVARNARQQYAAGLVERFGDVEFTRMMFLDGCFVLRFIFCYVREPEKMMMMISNLVMAFIRRDLLLLENQLPFEILQILMRLKFEDVADGMDLIDAFVVKIRGLDTRHSQPNLYKTNIKPSFISELTRRFGFFTDTTNRFKRNETLHLRDPLPAHLLDYFRSRFVDKHFLLKYRQRAHSSYSYPGAMELTTLGIHFIEGKDARFTAIRFIKTLTAGIVILPKLTMDDFTKSMLLNLAAYEACPGGPEDLAVTSYICFMDLLISRAEDIKELRTRGIIYNMLGSDKQAANLFHEMGKDLAPHSLAFVNVKDSIERYYGNKFKRWISEWLHTHFNSPWTVIALLAAILVLFLTIVQTYVAVVDHCNSDGRRENYCFRFFTHH